MAKKVVDDNNIKSVANAIRKKGKTTAQLIFPEGFVNAINKIKTDGSGGSSLPDGISDIYYGTYTPASDTDIIQIEHNLDAPIKVAAIWIENIGNNYNTMNSDGVAYQGFFKTDMGVAVGMSSDGEWFGATSFTSKKQEKANKPTAIGNKDQMVRETDRNTILFTTNNANNKRFVAGVEYAVLIVGGEG